MREPGFYFCKLYEDGNFEPAYFSQQGTWHFTLTDKFESYRDNQLSEIDERRIVREEPAE